LPSDSRNKFEEDSDDADDKAVLVVVFDVVGVTGVLLFAALESSRRFMKTGNREVVK